MAHRIAVFDYRIPREVQRQIASLSDAPVEFPEKLCRSPEEFIARASDADILLVTPWDKVTASLLDACPRVKYIGLCGTSTANIDMDELASRNIAFTNVTSSYKGHVAEFFFAQLTMLVRGIGGHTWRGGGHELRGKSMGIIGLGAVGQAMAHIALAYDMETLYFSPHRKPEWEEKGASYMEMPALLHASDILIISSPTNVQVLGNEEFARLKSNSILIQASSGSPFDRQTFLDWIAKEGNFAIFDKSAGEENYRAYKDLPSVVFPDAVAGDTIEANVRRGHKIIENMQAYLGTQ